MATWSTEELRKMLKPDDLHISPFRDDGVTNGTPTWIWFVAAGDALYVRAYSGQRSRWYQAAVRQKVGRITVAGMRKEVTFESVDGRSTTLSTTPTAQVPWQSISQLNARRMRSLRNSQGHAVRHRCLMVISEVATDRTSYP